MYPASVLALPEGGFLVSGHSSYSTWLARYSAQGLAGERQALVDYYDDTAARSAASAQALAVFPPPTDDLYEVSAHQACRYSRGPFELRWFAQWVLPGKPGDGLGTDGRQFGVLNPFSAPGEAGQAVLFGRDCHVTDIYRAPRIHSSQPIPGQAGAYIVEPVSESNGNPGGHVLRRIGIGGVLWERKIAPPLEGNYHYTNTSSFISPNGDIVSPLYAEDLTPPQQLARFGLDGSRLWTRPYLPAENRALILAETDATYFIDASQAPLGSQVAPDTVLALGNDGSQRWSLTLDPPDYQRRLPSARTDLPQPWVLAPLRVGTTPTKLATALVRPGTQGIVPVAPLRGDVEYLAELADGSVLARGLEPEARGALRLIGVDGRESAVPTARVPTAQRGAALLSDDDGSFLVAEDETGAARLHHLSKDGELRWKRSLPPRDSTRDDGRNLYSHFELAASAARVCALRIGHFITEPAQASCYARADGGVIFENATVPAFRYSEQSPLLRVDSAGGLDIVAFATLTAAEINPPVRIGLVRVALTPQGQNATSALLAEFHAGQGKIGLVSDDEGATLAIGLYESATRKTKLSVRTSNNAVRWLAQLDGEVHPLAVGADASVFAVGTEGFMDFDGDGRQRWTRFVTVAPYVASYAQGLILQPSGDRVVVFRNPADEKSQLMRLAAGDGRVMWQQSETAGPGDDGWGERLSASPSAELAFLVPGGTRHIGARKALGFDLRSGALRTAVHLPTTRDPHNTDEQEARLSVQNDGSVMTLDDRVELGQVMLRSLDQDHLLGTATDRLDASLLGAWTAEDTPGQGLMFDFDPDTRAVFGGWFTYSLDGGHHAAQQRWYSLSPTQGGASTESAEIELTIHRNRAGHFAQGPATSAERVGSARLRQIGCDRALFIYHFETAEEGRAQAAIPLRRSYARTRACQQDSAGVASIARPARGIDPRSAGTWYDPAHSGQGLLLDLRPPQGGDAGLIAGAWFTYDLDGHVDDPTAQHWFSLAGDLASAQDGRFEVPIFRTVGGRLDRDATNNTWRVGTATITFADCSHARLDFAFDNSDVAHAYAGRRGTLSLQRIGGCGD